jgi:hypothetical protein
MSQTTASNSEIQEKSISERFSVIWAQLNHNQRRFVVAMQESSTKREAATAIELEPDTVYRWPSIVDEAVELMALNIKDAAIDILANATAKAAMVKLAGLDSANEKIRQDVATEILDRQLGKPLQKSELTGQGGGPIETRNTVSHAIDSETAGSIFDILASVGAIQSAPSDAEIK